MQLTHRDYWTEIRAIASYFMDETSTGWRTDFDVDDDIECDAFKHECLTKDIERHRFVIYYSNAKAVMFHTDNEDAAVDVFGAMPEADYYGQLCTIMAYHAMMADVWSAMDRMTPITAKAENVAHSATIAVLGAK